MKDFKKYLKNRLEGYKNELQIYQRPNNLDINSSTYERNKITDLLTTLNYKSRIDEIEKLLHHIEVINE